VPGVSLRSIPAGYARIKEPCSPAERDFLYASSSFLQGMRALLQFKNNPLDILRRA